MNTSGYKTPNKRNASAPRYLLNLPTTLPPALAVPGAHVDDVARALGSEVSGLQLHELNDEQIKALERLIAERGVIFFRDQKMTLEQQVALGKRFGTGELHFHPNVPGPKGFPEVLPIKSNKDSNNVAGEAWHTDVSCDLRPPGLSILRIEETPPFGGDTLWASTTALYAKLSPTLRAYLDTLSAVHDSLQAGHGRHKASETLSETQQKYPRNVHPLIRTHPITGQRCLYVNSGFTTGIAGLGERESRGLLDVLFNHIASSPECHVRWRWSPNSVAIWDNRCTQHMALWDYYPFSRSGYRVTTLGERPFFDATKGKVGDMDEEGLLEEVARQDDERKAKARSKL